MKAVLVLGSIVLVSVGWMLFYARRAARRDRIEGKSLSKTRFPGSGGNPGA